MALVYLKNCSLPPDRNNITRMGMLQLHRSLRYVLQERSQMEPQTPSLTTSLSFSAKIKGLLGIIGVVLLALGSIGLWAIARIAPLTPAAASMSASSLWILAITLLVVL